MPISKAAEAEMALRGRLAALAGGLADMYGHAFKEKLRHVRVGPESGLTVWRLRRGGVLVWCAGPREGRAFFLEHADALAESYLVEPMLREVDARVREPVGSGHTA